MRAFVFASALSLGLAGAAEAAPVGRVASLNLCTDELLLMIARPDQILSVTHLAQQPAETPLWREARRHRRNDGSLVSVAGLRPNLVLTMGGGIRDRTGLAKRLGIKALDIPFPQSLDDVAKAIAAVSKAVGTPAAGAALVRRMQFLRRTAPEAKKDTVWLGGGGRTVQAGSLAAQWMGLAGFQQKSIKGERVSLEQLLMNPPEVILRSDYRSGQYSAEQRWLAHPLARGTRKSRTIVSDGRPWTCMGPPMIAEVERLRRARVR